MRSSSVARRTRTWVAAPLLLWVPLLLGAVSCSSIDGDLDASPLLRSQHHPGPEYTDTDVLGPFATHVETEDATKFGLRPIFMTEKRPWAEGEGRETVTSFIAPFGKYHSNPRTTQFRVWPLLWNTKTRTGDDALDKDFLLFPILMFGTTRPPKNALAAGEEPDTYLALFPLAGRVNSFVGWDRWEFLAWPILQRLRKRVFADEEIFNSIALLIGWTTGAPRGGSHHVLPLYYKSIWTYPPYRAPKYPEGADPSQPLPKYDKRSYLWPFIHYQELNLDAGPGKEAELLAVFPFFKHEKGYDHDFWTVLWPFFRYNREYPRMRESSLAKDELEPGSVDPMDKENTNVLIDVFTQLVFRYEKTLDYVRHRVLWLVYADYKSLPEDLGQRTSNDRIESMAILQPIGFWKRMVEKLDSTGGYRDDSIFFLVPFFQTHKRSYLDVEGKRDGRTDRFTRLWPLFSYERNADGSRDVHMLSILPLRVEKFTKDFLDSWGVFFNLYRYERASASAGGYTRHTALMNLVKVYEDERESSLSIPLLFTSRTVEERGVTKWSRRFLMGMFGWEGEEAPGGASTRRLRLFFLPLEL